jgi:fluoride exporter
MFKILMIVGTGSFAGGVMRYLAGLYMQRLTQSVYPYGTLSVNIIGCLLIGLFYGIAEKGNLLTPEWRIFLTTGLCGGFTTFSTFSHDALNLMNDRGIYTALVYVGISIFIGILFTFLGILITRSF